MRASERKGISLKKVITIIICLLCALTAFAVSYASPYRGSGRGYIHTTLHTATQGLAQAPVATMSSTSRGYGSHGVSTPIDTRTIDVVPVSGICTAASAIRGGVTTYDSGHVHGVSRKTPGHNDDVDECPYCVDEDGDDVCDICGHDIDDCTCEEEYGYCPCPLTDGWQVWLFMAVLAAGYDLYMKKRTSAI